MRIKLLELLDALSELVRSVNIGVDRVVYISLLLKIKGLIRELRSVINEIRGDKK